MNPLLATLDLPRFAEIRPDQIESALDKVIADHQAVVQMLVKTRPSTFAEVWLPVERAEAAISGVWSAVSHLHGVADTPELRAAYVAGQARLVENDLQVMQNEGLYDVLVALTATSEFSTLTSADRAAVEYRIRAFKLSGVALNAGDRARFAAISLELSGLRTAFGNAVLDATEAWFEHLEDETLLAVIPE